MVVVEECYKWVRNMVEATCLQNEDHDEEDHAD
jgi:hypothetical protein